MKASFCNVFLQAIEEVPLFNTYNVNTASIKASILKKPKNKMLHLFQNNLKYINFPKADFVGMRSLD